MLLIVLLALLIVLSVLFIVLFCVFTSASFETLLPQELLGSPDGPSGLTGELRTADGPSGFSKIGELAAKTVPKPCDAVPLSYAVFALQL